MAAKTPKVKYVILLRQAPGTTWEQLPDEYEGHGGEEAIQTAAKKLGVENGRFVAVAASAWRPGTISVEVETKISVTYEKPSRRRRHAAPTTPEPAQA